MPRRKVFEHKTSNKKAALISKAALIFLIRSDQAGGIESGVACSMMTLLLMKPILR